MRKILWYAFLLIPAVFTSCNLEDDSGLIPQEKQKTDYQLQCTRPRQRIGYTCGHRTGSRGREYKNARFDFLRIKR